MGRERTGSIVNRKGVLFARVSYVDSTGKRREITRKAESRADAKRIIAELHDRLDSHGEDAARNDRATVAGVIELYREAKAQPAVIRNGKKISGLKSSHNFGLMLDLLVEHFGHKKLRDLRPADLHAFKKKRLATKTQYGKDRTVADVNRTLEALRSVCRWCVRQGWLAKDPFSYGEVVIVKSHESSRDRVISFEEEKRLLAVCTGSREFLRPILILALDSAMRLGEILKCKWAFVDMAQGVINLPGEVTKTGKSRTIPLTYRAQSELEALREKAGGREDGLVFGVTDIKYAWQGACKDAGVIGVRFHDTRHSAVTRMIAAGIQAALVMKISGHDNMRTFQRYLNPTANTLRAEVEKLHDANTAEWGREDTGQGFIN